jgi:hypothetical protein
VIFATCGGALGDHVVAEAHDRQGPCPLPSSLLDTVTRHFEAWPDPANADEVRFFLGDHHDGLRQRPLNTRKNVRGRGWPHAIDLRRAIGVRTNRSLKFQAGDAVPPSSCSGNAEACAPPCPAPRDWQ